MDINEIIFGKKKVDEGVTHEEFDNAIHQAVNNQSNTFAVGDNTFTAGESDYEPATSLLDPRNENIGSSEKKIDEGVTHEEFSNVMHQAVNNQSNTFTVGDNTFTAGESDYEPATSLLDPRNESITKPLEEEIEVELPLTKEKAAEIFGTEPEEEIEIELPLTKEKAAEIFKEERVDSMINEMSNGTIDTNGNPVVPIDGIKGNTKGYSTVVLLGLATTIVSVGIIALGVFLTR